MRSIVNFYSASPFLQAPKFKWELNYIENEYGKVPELCF